jgi:hypothetical protein
MVARKFRGGHGDMMMTFLVTVSDAAMQIEYSIFSKVLCVDKKSARWEDVESGHARQTHWPML